MAAILDLDPDEARSAAAGERPQPPPGPDAGPTAVVRLSLLDGFELSIDGHLAELDYRYDGDRLVLVHTLVPDELGGKGVGGALVTAAIDQAAEVGFTVVPWCPFARQWLEHHADVAGKVTIERPDHDKE